MDPRYKQVIFANNNPGEVRDELFTSFVNLQAHDQQTHQYLGGFFTLRSGGCLSIFRNRVVEIFLNDNDKEWLWFVDSDIQLKEDTLDRLMEYADPEKYPVLGGNYFMAIEKGTIVPSMYYRKRFRDGTVRMAPIWTATDDYPKNQLVKCDGFGMGCTLIHRRVLEHMKEVYGFPEPWFAQQPINGIVHGEDLTFFHRVKELGYPAYVHTGIEVGHVKTTILDSAAMGLSLETQIRSK